MSLSILRFTFLSALLCGASLGSAGALQADPVERDFVRLRTLLDAVRTDLQRVPEQWSKTFVQELDKSLAEMDRDHIDRRQGKLSVEKLYAGAYQRVRYGLTASWKVHLAHAGNGEGARIGLLVEENRKLHVSLYEEWSAGRRALAARHGPASDAYRNAEAELSRGIAERERDLTARFAERYRTVAQDVAGLRRRLAGEVWRLQDFASRRILVEKDVHFEAEADFRQLVTTLFAYTGQLSGSVLDYFASASGSPDRLILRTVRYSPEARLHPDLELHSPLVFRMGNLLRDDPAVFRRFDEELPGAVHDGTLESVIRELDLRTLQVRAAGERLGTSEGKLLEETDRLVLYRARLDKHQRTLIAYKEGLTDFLDAAAAVSREIDLRRRELAEARRQLAEEDASLRLREAAFDADGKVVDRARLTSRTGLPGYVPHAALRAKLEARVRAQEGNDDPQTRERVTRIKLRLSLVQQVVDEALEPLRRAIRQAEDAVQASLRTASTRLNQKYDALEAREQAVDRESLGESGGGLSPLSKRDPARDDFSDDARRAERVEALHRILRQVNVTLEETLRRSLEEQEAPVKARLEECRARSRQYAQLVGRILELRREGAEAAKKAYVFISTSEKAAVPALLDVVIASVAELRAELGADGRLKSMRDSLFAARRESARKDAWARQREDLERKRLPFYASSGALIDRLRPWLWNEPPLVRALYAGEPLFEPALANVEQLEPLRGAIETGLLRVFLETSAGPADAVGKEVLRLQRAKVLVEEDLESRLPKRGNSSESESPSERLYTLAELKASFPTQNETALGKTLVLYQIRRLMTLTEARREPYIPTRDFKLPPQPSGWSLEAWELGLIPYRAQVGMPMLDRFVALKGAFARLDIDVPPTPGKKLKAKYDPDTRTVKIPKKDVESGRIQRIDRDFVATIIHESWHAYYHQIVTQGGDNSAAVVFQETRDWLEKQRFRAESDGRESSFAETKADPTGFTDEYIGALINLLVEKYVQVSEERRKGDLTAEGASEKWKRALDQVSRSRYTAYESAEDPFFEVMSAPPEATIQFLLKLLGLEGSPWK